MFRGKLGLAVAIAATSLVVVAPSASAEKYVAGSAGSGDPFFPQAGNGGYDVRHYSLTTRLRPAGQRAQRQGRDRGDHDPEPPQLQPRSARPLHGVERQGQRRLRDLRST